MYVEPLTGPTTVDTLPNHTIAAFADHGRVTRTIEEDLEAAAQVMQDLERIGIDVRLVTAQFVNEAIQKSSIPTTSRRATGPAHPHPRSR
jgi:transaldolase